MTKVITCTCKHKYQDAVYGKGKRLHNSCKESGSHNSPSWRCTVCGKVRSG